MLQRSSRLQNQLRCIPHTTSIRERAHLKGELVQTASSAKPSSSVFGAAWGHNSSFLQGPAFAARRVREVIWHGNINLSTKAAQRFSICSNISQESHEENPSVTISVDRTGLFTPPEHIHENREESPMLKHIKSLIRFRGGPITVADYMEEVLTNPTVGFYMNRDVFGSEGDFITSPDVSQMFGELIGVWSMCLWEQMGRPSTVNLVELGPGRGTLMADLLRGVSKFSNFIQAISVHLVECSPALRSIQQRNLGVEPTQATEVVTEAVKQKPDDLANGMFSSKFKCKVTWHVDLEQVPHQVPTIIIAHEFFDALPIYQFQKTSRGWCEKLVDVDENAGQGLRFVLSPGPKTASAIFLSKRLKWSSEAEIAELNQVEVCPHAWKHVQNIAQRVESDGGGALIVDYGEDRVISDSLQAIQKHKFVHVLHDPGKADLSAYVDFAALRHAVKESTAGASVFGPITQSHLLGMLGINFRLEALLKAANDKQADNLRSGYWRLVGEGNAPWWEGEDTLAPVGMGTRYKAFAVINSKLGVPQCFHSVASL